MKGFSAGLFFTFLILVIVFNSVKSHPIDYNDDDEEPDEIRRHQDASTLAITNNLIQALPRMDYVQIGKDLVDIVLKQHLPTYLFIILHLVDYILSIIHPIYVFIFPKKQDMGSFSANFSQGFSSMFKSMKTGMKLMKLAMKFAKFVMPQK